MQVKFTIDYDLIELVDAIGLDYEIVDRQSNLFDDYNRLSDEELCEFLLNPTLSEGLIYTQRIMD